MLATERIPPATDGLDAFLEQVHHKPRQGKTPVSDEVPVLAKKPGW